MLENIGHKDKIIRYVLGILLWITGIVIAVQTSTVLGIILIALALILIITALFNVCPIYILLNISTKKQSAEMTTEAS